MNQNVSQSVSSSLSPIALVNRLKFKHLALLVALDDARNLHQAADAINVAQPSASRMLADIEEAFGFLLFERNARGMQPTPLGTAALAYARRSLAETFFSFSSQASARSPIGTVRSFFPLPWRTTTTPRSTSTS